MSCPTCDHTMHNLRDVIFWCPRCGTIADNGDGGMFERPKLVERCRAFEKDSEGLFRMSMAWFKKWSGLGIAEAINKPEDRPT